MSRQKKPFNPFYVLLLIAGTMFAITACAYGVMMVRMVNPAAVESSGASVAAQEAQPSAAGVGLMSFLQARGDQLLLIELGVLAVATFAAIGTDEYWTRRAAASQPRPPSP